MEGAANQAGRLNLPGAMAILSPYLYVVDSGSHTIKRIMLDGSDDLRVFAGRPGIPGHHDGACAEATFNSPVDLVADSEAGILYVADRGNNRIRMISVLNLKVQSIDHAMVDPQGLAQSATGSLYVASPSGAVIEELEPGTPHFWGTEWAVKPVAGVRGRQGFEDGAGAHALFNQPVGLTLLDADRLLVADSGNNLIRTIALSSGMVDTYAGNSHERLAGLENDHRSLALFNGPTRLTLQGPEDVLVSDQQGRVLRRIGPDARVETLGVAAPQSATGAVNGAAGLARFQKPLGVVVNRAGEVYVADRDNHSIRIVHPNGQVDTFAGSLSTAGAGDGKRLDARFERPAELALDSKGRMWVLETPGHRLRMIDAKGEVSTELQTPLCIAACPTGKDSGLVMALPIPASSPVPSSSKVVFVGAHGTEVVVDTKRVPSCLALDADGHVFVLTEKKHSHKVVIQKFARSGAGWHQTGSLSLGPGGDKGKPFGLPLIHGMATDSKGSLFLADSANGLVWKLASDLKGAAVVAGHYPFLEPTSEAKPSNAALYQPHRIAVTPNDELILTSGHALLMITAPGTASDHWTPAKVASRPALAPHLGAIAKGVQLRKVSPGVAKPLSPEAARLKVIRDATGYESDEEDDVTVDRARPFVGQSVRPAAVEASVEPVVARTAEEAAAHQQALKEKWEAELRADAARLAHLADQKERVRQAVLRQQAQAAKDEEEAGW